MLPGAQLYSLRQYCRTSADLSVTLKRVADMGYRTVQASAICEIDYAQLREMCDALGLAVVATHIPPDLLLRDPDEVIRRHKVLGCPYIGIGGMPERFTNGVEGAVAFVRAFEPAMRAVRAAGLYFTYHNHCSEFEKCDGRTIFDVLVELTAPLDMKFTLDVYWAQVGGLDPAELLRRLAGRVDVCHFKDLAIVGEEQRYAAVGDGNLDWDKIIAAALHSGVRYAMVEQDLSYGRDIFDELKRSFDFLRERLAGGRGTC